MVILSGGDTLQDISDMITDDQDRSELENLEELPSDDAGYIADPQCVIPGVILRSRRKLEIQCFQCRFFYCSCRGFNVCNCMHECSLGNSHLCTLYSLLGWTHFTYQGMKFKIFPPKNLLLNLLGCTMMTTPLKNLNLLLKLVP